MILTPDDLRTPYMLREWPDGRALAWGSQYAAEWCRELGFNVLVLTAAGVQFEDRDFGGADVIRMPYEDDGAAMADERLKARLVEVAKSVAWRLRSSRAGTPARVLVTCAMGYNRSALVAARVLHEATGWPGFLCVSEIRKVRPGALFRSAFREWAES